MKRLPKFLKKYFWDVNFAKINLDKRRIYVLKRLLEYGDEEAVAWMWRNFTESEMKNALYNFRGYSQKSAWRTILGRFEDVKFSIFYNYKFRPDFFDPVRKELSNGVDKRRSGFLFSEAE